MSKFLWCEDSGSGYQFWCTLCKSLYPDITVESKKNNSRLRRAAEEIQDDENEYYILMDKALDNPDVIRENQRLLKKTENKDNVHVILIHPFELALLSFSFLEQWVFAEQDALQEQRQDLLRMCALFVKFNTEAEEPASLVYYKEIYRKYPGKNTEQIAAKLLFEITRNTGFETDKGTLGPCFVVDCCDWQERQSNDICGLEHNKISAHAKAEQLVEYSIIKQAFEGVGLK